jgi:hypothetical protein
VLSGLRDLIGHERSGPSYLLCSAVSDRVITHPNLPTAQARPAPASPVIRLRASARLSRSTPHTARRAPGWAQSIPGPQEVLPDEVEGYSVEATRDASIREAVVGVVLADEGVLECHRAADARVDATP